jgi:hypothetical protein
MGHWIGRDSQRFYVESGIVLSSPRGVPLPIHPETLEPLAETPLHPKDERLNETEEKRRGVVLDDFTDETKVGGFVIGVKNKPIEHLKECKSQGRGGRYTEDCPKCSFLKKGK